LKLRLELPQRPDIGTNTEETDISLVTEHRERHDLMVTIGAVVDGVQNSLAVGVRPDPAKEVQHRPTHRCCHVRDVGLLCRVAHVVESTSVASGSAYGRYVETGSSKFHAIWTSRCGADRDATGNTWPVTNSDTGRAATAARTLSPRSRSIRLTRRLALGFALIAFLGACGSSDVVSDADTTSAGAFRTDGGEFTALENALTVRESVTNQTGRQDLSLTDYIVIGDAVCRGAINDPEQLLELSRTWNLGVFTSDAQGAAALWTAARQYCVDRFDPDTLAAGPGPGVAGNGSGPAPPTQLDTLPAAIGEFVDIEVLDSPPIFWREGIDLSIASTTAMSGQEAVEHFRTQFPAGWTVNEVVGPVLDRAGFNMWSIDVDGPGWSGVVDVLEGPPGSFGNPERTTFVLIFFVPA